MYTEKTISTRILAATGIVVGLFLWLACVLATLAFDAGLYASRFVLLPFCVLIPTCLLFLASAVDIRLPDLRSNKNVNKRLKQYHVLVSLVYHANLKRSYRRQAVALLGASLAAEIPLALLGADHINVAVFVICGAYVFMLFLRTLLIRRRIMAGTFATNAVEAKELLLFILRHAENWDLRDRTGKPKSAFFPEHLLHQPSPELSGAEVWA